MHDGEPCLQVLGIQPPWVSSEVNVDLPGAGVTFRIRHSGIDLACPQCTINCPRYDNLERKWRHLDTCQYNTWLVAQVSGV